MLYAPLHAFPEPNVQTTVPVALQPSNGMSSTVSLNDFQGNKFNFESTTMSDLHPLSSIILKAIQKKEYVDFNAFLPTSLYDYTADQPALNFQINPYELGNNTVALSSYDIYIRGQIYFFVE